LISLEIDYWSLKKSNYRSSECDRIETGSQCVSAIKNF
jgi:hypothetical protein